MKDFPNCPKCGGILQNDYAPIGPHEEVLTKICKKSDHYFKCTLDSNSNKVERVTIRISTAPFIKVSWNIDSSKVIVTKGTLKEALEKGGGDFELPFFEPDFTNYDRLVEKIKTLLIFS
jgi:hypothetical protein